MTVNAKSLAVLPQVDAVLNYLAPTNEKPCHYAGHLEQDERQAVATYERRRVRVHDARSVAESLSLDDEGCRLVQHESAVRDFWNDEEVRRVYYPEAEALIAAATGACWAFGFDHTVRSRIYGLPDRTPGAPRQPVLRVHADYTEFSAPRRMRDLMGQAADSLLRRRFAVISAWRPIRGPLYDAPLALCDANSTTPGDLVAADLIYRDRIGDRLRSFDHDFRAMLADGFADSFERRRDRTNRFQSRARALRRESERADQWKGNIPTRMFQLWTPVGQRGRY